MASSRKRKRESTDDKTADSGSRNDISLQAFEAVINPIDRQQNIKLASGQSGGVSSTGLIEWSVSGLSEPVLTDRYDARLLLDTLTTNPQPQGFDKPVLEDGWEDLEPDSEDLFFFSLDEAEDIRREKRRRLIESNHEARLSAMRASDPVEPTANSWGGSDEEPEASEMALMRKTAAYIVSSPNPVQLEMRILANHGGDPRFAFLRGRWKRTWETTKEGFKPQSMKVSSSKPSGLVSYDSGGEEDRDVDELPEASGNILSQAAADDARIKAERRARVKEWSRKRKEDGGQ